MFRWIPTTYPSYRSNVNNPMALEVVRSAFENEGNYLYLAWDAYLNNKVYASIMNNWNYYDYGDYTERAWFTRSISEEYIDESSHGGVTLWRHYPYDGVRYLYESTSGEMKIKSIVAYY